MDKEVLTYIRLDQFLADRFDKLNTSLWQASIRYCGVGLDVAVPIDHEFFFCRRNVFKFIGRLTIKIPEKG